MPKRLWDRTDCIFSDELPRPLYRYTLTRYFPTEIGRKGRVAFVLLNPSTADETKDDPTVRRCVGYAYDWGYAELDILNIFAYRDTDPKVLLKIADPIGPNNDRWIKRRLKGVDLVVCGWGADPAVVKRQPQILKLIRDAGHTPTCLTMTGAGHPGHPLYLAKTLRPRTLTPV